MKFLGLPQLTTIDYPKKLAFIVYTPECNFACGACYAGKVKNATSLVDETDVLKFMSNYQNLDWVKGLVICGGEPTIHKDLPSFIKKAKQQNQEVKLDTNGSNPDMLEELLWNNDVDYVAMDVKAPKELYSRVAGKEINLANIERSMKLTSQFPSYEFRTTIFPLMREDEIIFMTADEILGIAQWIKQTTSKQTYSHYIQGFKAKSKEEMIDLRYSIENLTFALRNTPVSLLEEIKTKLNFSGYPCEIR
jgi:pyruvate formate lyase activating enzyme